ncbi:MAG: metalloprotease PmbA [Fluviibacter sp.]
MKPEPMADPTPTNEHLFAHSREALTAIADDLLSIARQNGASASEVEISEGFGQSVNVRQGEVETIEHHRDKQIGVTVYLGQRKGYASTSDFSRDALQATVRAALDIAKFTAEDPCAGLPDENLLMLGVAPDLDLYHPWTPSVETAVNLARECEAAGLALGPVIQNSEGASVSTHQGHFIMANSLGFMAGYPTSRHSVGCALIAADAHGMQRDDWYESVRDAALLPSVADIGLKAAQRAAARLGARQCPTGEVPVIFEAPLASTIVGNLVHAASGGALYRKSSFLEGALGKKILPEFVVLEERPLLRGGQASAPFDSDGLPTCDRDVIRDGVLNGYFLSVYSARKLGMAPTANGGGSHNLFMRDTRSGHADLAALMKTMGRGLLVTELLGQGVNYVNGDYSRGAAGFWVENGEIAYPVEEITIAGNMNEMLAGIVAIADDRLARSAKQSGAILIDRMMVAGA